MATQKEYTDREFEDYLTDIYGEVDVCGLKYDSGHLLRLVDETAFNCSRNDLPEVWECDECEKTYDTEEEADECCKEETEVTQ